MQTDTGDLRLVLTGCRLPQSSGASGTRCAIPSQRCSARPAGSPDALSRIPLGTLAAAVTPSLLAMSMRPADHEARELGPLEPASLCRYQISSPASLPADCLISARCRAGPNWTKPRTSEAKQRWRRKVPRWTTKCRQAARMDIKRWRSRRCSAKTAQSRRVVMALTALE